MISRIRLSTLAPIQKEIRADVITRHLHFGEREPKVMCCSCGTSAYWLRRKGLDVIELGQGREADFRPTSWLQPFVLQRMFPDRFDATSGHLPLYMMIEIAELMKERLSNLKTFEPNMEAEYVVPTGSGETILCLSFAFPELKLFAEYNTSTATQFEQQAYLNGLVKSKFPVIFGGQNIGK